MTVHAAALAPARPLWTVDDLASFLRVSERTVRRRIADGTLPAIKVGGVVRFDGEAVVAAATGLSQAEAAVVADLADELDAREVG